MQTSAKATGKPSATLKDQALHCQHREGRSSLPLQNMEIGPASELETLRHSGWPNSTQLLSIRAGAHSQNPGVHPQCHTASHGLSLV